MKQPISKEAEEPKGAPRWETAVMALSFIAIWVWYLARQSAYKAQSDFPVAWNIMLLAFVGLLVWVFVRRMKRTLTAMKSIQPGNQRR